MSNTERGDANSNEEERVAKSSISDSGVADVDDESAMIAEVLGADTAENLRPEARHQIARFVANITSVGVTGFNPLLRTLTSEHILKILDNRDRSDERAHTSEASERRYRFLYFVIGLIAAIGLLVFFSATNDREMLTTVLVALLGFAGGFGLGRTTRRS